MTNNIELGLPERFRAIKLIGGGARGSVYEVFDTALDQTLALKIFRMEVAGNELPLDYFSSKLVNVKELSHPQIACLYAWGITNDGHPYMVMDWVSGTPLAELLQKKTATVTDYLQISVQICGALEHAHERNITHEELDSGNVIVSPNERRHEEGWAFKVKVVDFGAVWFDPNKIGSAGDSDNMQSLRTTGNRKRPAPDVSSDLYSLGLLMQQMFASSGIEILNDETAAILDSAIGRCLGTSTSRYRSVSDLFRDLNRLLNARHELKKQ